MYGGNCFLHLIYNLKIDNHLKLRSTTYFRSKLIWDSRAFFTLHINLIRPMYRIIDYFWMNNLYNTYVYCNTFTFVCQMFYTTFRWGNSSGLEMLKSHSRLNLCYWAVDETVHCLNHRFFTIFEWNSLLTISLLSMAVKHKAYDIACLKFWQALTDKCLVTRLELYSL